MKCLYGDALEKALVKQEFSAAERIGELRLGKTLLLHRYFFRTVYIRYQDICRVYQRIESGESGDFTVAEHSLVVVDSTGKEHVLHVDYEQYARECIEKLTQQHRNIVSGKSET